MSAPKVGEEVAVIANDISLEKQGKGKGITTLNLDLRLGIVTEVVMGPSPLQGQSFYFRTTIPVTGGMSGAAIVNKPVAGETMVVRGVVSSDISPKDAFKSFLVAGDSAASMIWPAMGLALNVTLPPDPPKHMFLAELLHRNLLDDRSNGIVVDVRRSRTATEILYTDNRVAPPSRLLLSTTPHPNV